MTAASGPVRSIDWVREANEIGASFRLGTEVLGTPEYTFARVQHYNKVQLDAEEPGNFVATGNCKLNAATIYMIGSDKLLMPCDLSGNAILGKDRVGRYRNNIGLLDRRANAVLYIMDTVLRSLRHKKTDVKVFISKVISANERTDVLACGPKTIPLPVKEPLFHDRFNLGNFLDHRDVGLLTIDESEVSRLADDQFETLQARGLEPTIKKKEICIILANPVVFPKIRKAFLPDTRWIQFVSNTFNIREEDFPFPPPPPHALISAREGDIKGEYDHEGTMPTLADTLRIAKKTNASHINCFKMLKVVDSSSKFPNVHRLKMSDISSGIQMIYASIFVSHFSDVPTIVLFPRSICHPKPEDQPSLLKRFKDSVVAMGGREVRCLTWRDRLIDKPRHGVDNDDALVLNYYAKQPKYRSHIIVMIGPETSFSPRCERRLQHFGHMDLVFSDPIANARARSLKS